MLDGSGKTKLCWVWENLNWQTGISGAGGVRAPGVPVEEGVQKDEPANGWLGGTQEWMAGFIPVLSMGGP